MWQTLLKKYVAACKQAVRSAFAGCQGKNCKYSLPAITVTLHTMQQYVITPYLQQYGVAHWYYQTSENTLETVKFHKDKLYSTVPLQVINSKNAVISQVRELNCGECPHDLWILICLGKGQCVFVSCIGCAYLQRQSVFDFTLYS